MRSLGNLDAHVDPYIQAVIVKAAFGGCHDLQLANGCLAVLDRRMRPVAGLHSRPVDGPRKTFRERGRRYLSILKEYPLMIADHEPEFRITLLQLHDLMRLCHLQLPVIIPRYLLCDDANGFFIGIFQLRIDDPDPTDEQDEKENEKKGLQGDQAFYQPPA